MIKDLVRKDYILKPRVTANLMLLLNPLTYLGISMLKINTRISIYILETSSSVPEIRRKNDSQKKMTNEKCFSSLSWYIEWMMVTTQLTHTGVNENQMSTLNCFYFLLDSVLSLALVKQYTIIIRLPMKCQ